MKAGKAMPKTTCLCQKSRDASVPAGDAGWSGWQVSQAPRRTKMKGMISILTVLTVILTGTTGSRAQPFEGLDAPEQQAMYDTFQYALENNPSNQAADWVNPDTGRSGMVMPIATYDNHQGQPCREFITTIIIGGREEQGYGTACRQPDGSWQIVSDAPNEESAAPQATTYYAAPPVQVYLDRYYYCPGYYPDRYYYFPSGLYAPYYPYNIYLSFSYIHRGGHRYYGTHYLAGRTFYRRHPRATRKRVVVRPPYRYQPPSWNPRTHRQSEIRVLRPAPNRPVTQPRSTTGGRPAPGSPPRRDDRIRHIGPDRRDGTPRQLEHWRRENLGTQRPGSRRNEGFQQQNRPQQGSRIQPTRPRQDGSARQPVAPQQEQRVPEQNWSRQGRGDSRHFHRQTEQRPRQQNRPSHDGRSRQTNRQQPDHLGRPARRP